MTILAIACLSAIMTTLFAGLAFTHFEAAKTARESRQ